MVFNSSNRKGKTAATPEAERLSEARKKEVSVRLKTVDKLIREGDLDEAEFKLGSVRVMDPRNGYVLALGERIKELRKAKENPQPVELPKKGDESSEGTGNVSRVEADYLRTLHEEVHKLEERLEAEYRKRFEEEFKKSERRIAEMLKEERENRTAETAALSRNLEKEQLETEYHEKLVKEIKKSERRIAEMLKEERQKHKAETSALNLNFEKEKEKLLKELKRGTKQLFDVEFKKADDRYRKLLADRIKKAEEKARGEISALHNKEIVELKEVLTKESGGLSDVEREAILAEFRKQTEDELQVRFAEELAKAKTALVPKRGEPEEIWLQPQTNPEEESGAVFTHVGGKTEAQLSGVKAAMEGRNRKSLEEAHEAPSNHPMETKQDNPKITVESETRLPQMQKEGEIGLGIKSEEQLVKEREHMDKLWGKEFDDIRNGVDWKDRSKKKKK